MSSSDAIRDEDEYIMAMHDNVQLMLVKLRLKADNYAIGPRCGTGPHRRSQDWGGAPG